MRVQPPSSWIRPQPDETAKRGAPAEPKSAELLRRASLAARQLDGEGRAVLPVTAWQTLLDNLRLEADGDAARLLLDYMRDAGPGFFSFKPLLEAADLPGVLLPPVPVEPLPARSATRLPEDEEEPRTPPRCRSRQQEPADPEEEASEMSSGIPGTSSSCSVSSPATPFSAADPYASQRASIHDLSPDRLMTPKQNRERGLGPSMPWRDVPGLCSINIDPGEAAEKARLYCLVPTPELVRRAQGQSPQLSPSRESPTSMQQRFLDRFSAASAVPDMWSDEDQDLQ